MHIHNTSNILLLTKLQILDIGIYIKEIHNLL